MVTQQTDSQYVKTEIEKLYTIKEAAALLGLKYHHLLKAVRSGLVPSHQLMNSRRFVLISEVRSAMTTFRGVAA